MAKINKINYITKKNKEKIICRNSFAYKQEKPAHRVQAFRVNKKWELCCSSYKGIRNALA